jgi:hypothetical protein
MNTLNAYSRQSGTAIDAKRGFSLLVRADRFTTALASLGVAYALSWVELALASAVGLPGDADAHPLAASIVARALVGVLYLCVAGQLQWARWLTVALGFASVAFVAPTLATQWHVFPAAAVVSGAALACKVSAAIFLLNAGKRAPA